MLSDSSDKDARRIAHEFEQMRTVFASGFPTALVCVLPEPVTRTKSSAKMRVAASFLLNSALVLPVQPHDNLPVIAIARQGTILIVIWNRVHSFSEPALLDHIRFDQSVRITILANWFTGLRDQKRKVSRARPRSHPFASSRFKALGSGALQRRCLRAAATVVRYLQSAIAYARRNRLEPDAKSATGTSSECGPARIGGNGEVRRI